MASAKTDTQGSNRQLTSLLLRLPLEMRLEIYSRLFLSTRVTSGVLGNHSIAPAPNALALLRTCHQVYAEIGPTWLEQVLFDFVSAEAMLDKLDNIPTETRALIRHVRVSGDDLVLPGNGGNIYYPTLYHTFQVLKLLPGLALDRLTVLGTRDSMTCYEALDLMILHGNGWKELHYLARDSTFLAYRHNWFSFTGGADAHRFLRSPQPADWQQTMNERDGSASNASVAIYRATSRDACSVLLQPATRAPFAQHWPVDRATFGKKEDTALMAPGEREKEVLVVVTRGRGVKYAEKEGSFYFPGVDLREWVGEKTWTQIRSEGKEEPDLSLYSGVDKYTHVDEYVWR
jgi:hypothetical protein